jgi:hypothetical protein
MGRPASPIIPITTELRSNEMDQTALSEFDFMELVVFDRKVESEGSFQYAAENYAPAFKRDGYRRCDDLTRLSDLLREYADRIDEHNAHVVEADRRERERAN